MSVDNLEAVRERLRERGAARNGQYLENNTFFDTEDRSLLAADEGLRLRRMRNVETGSEQHVITYKGPRQQGRLKSREEVEVSVVGSDGTVELLGRLGYQRVLSFEKRRESWLLDGCKVELDEVPHLGSFVEVEGPGEEAVMRVRESLKLSDRPILKSSYIAMLMSHLQERGQSARKEITF